ncbi:hypothetical protein [uncultured Winogradskyella sp.]|uniref:hypothetical protein n=1 Tax=uncultured Winogradskyella sp. TaxID=395353 RepID=UPI00263917BD|nr:hypothetical protein [uncultured Winogradskyella sp.]|tara:strand:- start:10915 stop:11367 length:453 start_codon:yes stop_codon:yes gene_type:complete
MKKIALLAFVFILTFSSCSLDDNPAETFYLEVLPIESVEMPEYFVHGETYEILVTYTKPNSCYYFNDFIYEIEDQERTVAIVNTVYLNSTTSCDGEPEQVTVSFDFLVNGNETYVFKFYQGEDEDGTDQYYLVEVPVMDGRGYFDQTARD